MDVRLNGAKLLSRIILVLVAGTLFALTLHNENVADKKRGNELTLEKYTADYEAYKAKLMDTDVSSIPFDITLMVFLMALFFGVYELVVWVLSLLIEAVLKQVAPNEEPDNPFRTNIR